MGTQGVTNRDTKSWTQFLQLLLTQQSFRDAGEEIGPIGQNRVRILLTTSLLTSLEGLLTGGGIKSLQFNQGTEVRMIST